MTAFRPIDTTPYRTAQVRDQQQPSLFWVELSQCLIDPRYQRAITIAGQRAIQRIADDWDWRRYQPILVAAAEGGRFAIVDGQHRATAAAVAGLSSLPAMQVPMTPQEQAAAFAGINRDRIRLDATSIFRADLAAGTALAVAADAAVRAAGCTMATALPTAKARRPRVIYGPVTILRMVEAGLSNVVTVGLSAIADSAAGDDVSSYEARVLRVWFEALSISQLNLKLPNLPAIFASIAWIDLFDRGARQMAVSGQSSRAFVLSFVATRLEMERKGAAA